ncbi:MAG: MurR/RpiR family transcriptional regulator [Nocardioidaceae bacterium]
MSATSQPLEDRINARFDDLSRQERRAAEAILEHLTDLGTYRASELAELAGVSKATFSRLVRRLGYDDFAMLRDDLRRRRHAGVPVATGPTPGLSAAIAQDVANLHRLHAVLEQAALDEIVEAIANARRVVITGQRSAYPVASALRMNLQQMRPDTTLVPSAGQSLAEDIVGIGPDDLAIVISFRRHSPGVRDLLEVLGEASTRIVLIGDSRLRPLSPRATWWIECPEARAGAFDSHTTAMSTVAILSDLVLDALLPARERVDHVDLVYHKLNEVTDH